MCKRVGAILLLGLVGVCGGFLLTQPGPSANAAPTQDANLEQMLKKATVDGKYRMLLTQIKVEKDRQEYGEFRDLGMRNMPTYGDHRDLPKGYWVWVQPYWYIWRDLASVQRPMRDWGPEQATGEPNTNMAGDIVTAWASQSQDGQDEWLMLEYAEPINPTAVLVYETFNPGALVRVTAFKLDGEEVELWKGQDPTTTDNDMGISEVPVKADFRTARIKLYIDSKNVPGWNEIDAVGVRDQEKKMHWAVSADASSTYAPPYDAMPAAPAFLGFGAVYENRIRMLETEVRQLKEMMEEMKKKLDKNK